MFIKTQCLRNPNIVYVNTELIETMECKETYFIITTSSGEKLTVSKEEGETILAQIELNVREM
jgi:uncharacterized protein YlzI (FlbEa/FlbD family)